MAKAEILRRVRWKPFFGLALSAGIIFFIVRVVPLREAANVIASANLKIAFLGAAFATLSILLRAVRWTLFFHQPRPTVIAALGPFAIGIGANGLIPGRVGDAVRIMLARKKFGVPLVFAGGTVVGERIVDALTMLLFLSVATIGIDLSASSEKISILGMTVSAHQVANWHDWLQWISVFAVIGLTLLLSNRFRVGIVNFLKRIPGIGTTLGEYTNVLWNQLADSVAVLARPTSALLVVACSIIGWGLLVMTNWLAARAMPGIDLTLAQSMMLTAITIAISSLPSAPGAWGVFEAGAALSLTLSGVHVSPDVSLAYGILAHLCQYIPTVSSGALAVLITTMRGERIHLEPPTNETS